MKPNGHAVTVNRDTGDVSIPWEGRTLTLRLDLNAMVTLEAMFSVDGRTVTVAQVIDHVRAGSTTHMRAILWAATRAHHPDMTLDDVGRMRLVDVGERLQDLVAGLTPDPADLDALNVRPPKAQPRKRKRGTGDAFSSMRGASG